MYFEKRACRKLKSLIIKPCVLRRDIQEREIITIIRNAREYDNSFSNINNSFNFWPKDFHKVELAKYYGVEVSCDFSIETRRKISKGNISTV